jgi:hypothetical protein
MSDKREPLKIPRTVRTEIEVLGPDDPKRRTPGWMCYEVRGAEIYFFDREVHGDGIVRDKLRTIPKDGMTEGLEILVPALVGGFYVNEGRHRPVRPASAHNEHTGAILEFSKDDRQCWVSLGAINLKGLKKLEKHTDAPGESK